MLIPSERFLRGDLDVWNANAEAYREIGRRQRIDEKTERAIDAIKALSGTLFVSVSWGKDSVAIAYLTRLAGLKLPHVWLKESPMHNPHCEDVREEYLRMFPDTQYHEVVIDYGRVGFEPFLDEHGDSVFFHQIADAVDHTFGKRITGIRSEESNKRRLRMSRWGIETTNTAAPIGWWKTQDVFAFLLKHDLPIHPNYAMTGNGRYDPLRIRVDCVAGTQGNGIGRTEWEREYYGDVLNRLEKYK